MTAMQRLAAACVVLFFGSTGMARQTAPATASTVTPGELIVDPPTLINLGVEWLIDGDANRNARVDVSYRKAGDSAWQTGMPLLRLQHERVTQPNVFNLVSPNMFAGSILDLEPDTAYEARFVMADPDGLAGPAANATRTVTMRTRPEPKPAEGGTVYHVYPVGPHRASDRTGVHRHHVRLQLLLRRRRHGAGRPAAREAGRHPPGARRTYAYRYEISTPGCGRARRRSIAACRCRTSTNGFMGRAPDLGALEAGQPLPIYGPRPCAFATRVGQCIRAPRGDVRPRRARPYFGGTTGTQPGNT